MNIDMLIEKITKEVIDRIKDLESVDESRNKGLCKREKTLVIIPRHVTKMDELLGAVSKMHSDCNILTLMPGYLLDNAMYKDKFYALDISDAKTRKSVIDDLFNIQHICCLSPGIRLLEKIADMDDDGFVEYIMINSLIQRKNTYVITDVEYDRLPDYEPFIRIKNVCGKINAMGICMKYLGRQYSDQKDLAKVFRGLITEQDIVEISKNGTRQIICGKGSIITPLASDKAKEIGITIQFIESKVEK